MNVEQTDQEAILTFTISLTRTEVDELLGDSSTARTKFRDALRRARAAYARQAGGFDLGKPANPIPLEA